MKRPGRILSGRSLPAGSRPELRVFLFFLSYSSVSRRSLKAALKQNEQKVRVQFNVEFLSPRKQRGAVHGDGILQFYFALICPLRFNA